MEQSRHTRHATSLLLSVVLSACWYLAVIVTRYEPYSFLNYDPGWSAETVRSLVDDHDFDLKNQLSSDPKAAGDQTALGIGGQWYPVHELLLPIIAVPFFTAFGLNGLLLVNLCLALFFTAGSYKVASLYCNARPAFLAALASAVAPVTLEYVYSFSADLLGATLFVWAFYYAASRSWLLAGFFSGAAVFGRTVNGFVLPAFLFLLLMDFLAGLRDREIERGKHLLRPLIHYLVGGLPFAAAFFIANQLMFGGPFEVAYRHWINPAAGPVPFDQANMFGLDRSEFIKLFADKQTGLIVGAPIVFVAWFFGLNPLRSRDRVVFQFYLATVFCLIAGVAISRRPFPGMIGNRYLLGLVATSALPLALTISRFTVPRASKTAANKQEQAESVKI